MLNWGRGWGFSGGNWNWVGGGSLIGIGGHAIWGAKKPWGGGGGGEGESSSSTANPICLKLKKIYISLLVFYPNIQ